MSTLYAIWKAHLLSIRNTDWRDRRLRVALIFMMLFDIAAGCWSGSQLIVRIHQWQAAGEVAVQAGLWLLCLLAWGGMAGIAILESLQQGLSNDTSALLFTLPISPAIRFRALYSTFFLTRLWNWLLLEVGVMGIVLVITLGWWQGLFWLLLLQVGMGCVVYVAMVITWLFLRYMLVRGRRKIAIIIGVTLGLVVMVAGWVNVFSVHIGQQVAPILESVAFLLLVFMLIMVLGPLANLSGKLYTSAFLTVQQWDRSRKSILLPGMRQMSELLARKRNLAGALLVKGLLNQSRNFFFWGRMVVVAIALFFFPQIHAVLAHQFSDTFFVVAYSAGLALFTILEQAPNALSGEGDRLTLYLTAPFDSVHMLRAKLLSFLLPVLMVGLAANFLLSWRLGLTIGVAGFTTPAVMVVIMGCTALPVWGSIWDEDLHLAIEGTVQMIMQEEAAITPKRLALLNLSVVLFVMSCLIIWKLPLIIALLVLVMVHGLVAVIMLRLSQAYMYRLVRVG